MKGRTGHKLLLDGGIVNLKIPYNQVRAVAENEYHLNAIERKILCQAAIDMAVRKRLQRCKSVLFKGFSVWRVYSLPRRGINQTYLKVSKSTDQSFSFPAPESWNDRINPSSVMDGLCWTLDLMGIKYVLYSLDWSDEYELVSERPINEEDLKAIP
jgi:hypothetical protein